MSRLRQFIKWAGEPTNLGKILVFTAVVIFTLGYINQHAVFTKSDGTQVEWFNDSPIITDFYANLSMELVTIAFTILIVDNIYKRRNEEQEKQELILQMGSHDNAIAREAVRKLRQRQWIFDQPSMRRADLGKANLHLADLDRVEFVEVDLREANLQGANLESANLGGADLSRADLRPYIKGGEVHSVTNLTNTSFTDANLSDANLEGANVTDMQISKARRLQGATMVSGKRYNGRFNLEGDLLQARFVVIFDNPRAMARFYGVSEEAYLWGQEWYHTCWKGDPPQMYSSDLPRWYQLNNNPDGPSS